MNLTMDAKKTAIKNLAAHVFKEREELMGKTKLDFAKEVYAFCTEGATQEELEKIPSAFRSIGNNFECRINGSFYYGGLETAIIIPRTANFNNIDNEELRIKLFDIRNNSDALCRSKRDFSSTILSAIKNKRTRGAVIKDYPELDPWIPNHNAIATQDGRPFNLSEIIEKAKNERP